MGKKSRKLRSPKYAKKAATLRKRVEELRIKANNITKTLEKVEEIVESLEVTLPPTPTPEPEKVSIEVEIPKKVTKKTATRNKSSTKPKPKTTRKRSTRKPTVNK